MTEEHESVPEDADLEETSTGGEEPAFEPPSTSRSLRQLAEDLWHQKPGAREGRERPLPTKEIVNGLDQREYLYGWIATVLGIATGLLAYFAKIHLADHAVRSEATVELAAFFVAWLAMVAGTALRRRALLGFASFLVGLEFTSYLAGLIGVLWLGFGFWLISRVMKRQRIDREARKTETVPVPGRTRAGTPVASKRYTPPRKRSASGRRR